ncbi:MAG: hypothetical protein A2Z25_09040 [Planctomycetes bacterium RBG_16_55_9]|nr:MAG: hypothetical protein A2Z25_09040 [Planctomycetes bacterium RBG_16_55_9]
MVRGNAGPERRAVNIPWVQRDRQYTVSALFIERTLGDFTGRQLQSDGVQITLPAYGQEILELTPGK